MGVVAAIDVGTNSFHLVVASIDDHGRIEVLTRERESVRLGEGADDAKGLTADAINRGVAALNRMRRIATHAGAPGVAAVATSALREARNSQEFLDRAQFEALVNVEIVSGAEEARLIHLGVLSAVPLADTRHLVVDIGGGSTEFVVADGPEPLLLRSVKMGAIRLTDRFFPKGRSSTQAERQCRAFVGSRLGGLPADIADHGFEVAIGTSGTIMSLARMCALRRGDRESRTGRLSFTATELGSLTADLVAAGTSEERLQIDGVEDRRADIIVGGAVLLNVIFALTGVEEMEVTDYALREGILIEQMRRRAKEKDVKLHDLVDLRRSSVMHLAQNYHEDIAQVEHIAELALELFDGLSHLHKMGADERELLEAAALLHRVGVFISHGGQHQHSYYIIRNSESLTGFTEREIEIIAQVARYHRKAAPKNKHPAFASLGRTDQQRVRWMAAMLRVALGLDRSDRQIVTRVRVENGQAPGDAAELRLLAGHASDIDSSIELFSAQSRSKLLSDVARRPVVVEPEILAATS